MLQFMEHRDSQLCKIVPKHAIREVGWSFSHCNIVFYSSIIFGVKKLVGMGGCFCTKLDVFNEKNCCSSQYFALYFCRENLNSVRKKYPSVSVQIPPVSAGSCNSQAARPPLSQKAELPGTPPAFVTHSPFDEPAVSTSWDLTSSQRAQPQGRHGAQGTWMVISEVCNSSWNPCCIKGQMDLIKYFHFKTLEHFI